jgi:hypothetical protein
MALARTFKFALAGLALLGATAALGVWLFWARIERYAAGVHQRSITQELHLWGEQYASVTNDASAIRAAEMAGYIGHYYVPGPGYRGPADIEAGLERQRGETLKRIAEAPQRYTHLDYGTNAKRWSEWAEKQKKQNSEPAGAASRGQPIGSETTRTSTTAGPGG